MSSGELDRALWRQPRERRQAEEWPDTEGQPVRETRDRAGGMGGFPERPPQQAKGGFRLLARLSRFSFSAELRPIGPVPTSENALLSEPAEGVHLAAVSPPGCEAGSRDPLRIPIVEITVS